MSTANTDMSDVENFKMQRYLNAVFLSLGRPIEITMQDGRLADGFFGGFDFVHGLFRVYNFCYYLDERVEKLKTLELTSVKYFTAKEISRKPRPMTSALGQPQLSSQKRNSLGTEAKGKTAEAFPVLNSNRRTIKAEPWGDGNGELQRPSLTLESKKPSVKDKVEVINGKNKRAPLKVDTFHTDKEIAATRGVQSSENMTVKTGGRGAPKFKEFKKFVVEARITEHEQLESMDRSRFDQFALNKQTFGVGTEFNENEYTTELRLDEFNEAQIRDAEKKANDILFGNKDELLVNTRHILEERGLLPLQDNDNEEALYSAVERVDEPEAPYHLLKNYSFKLRHSEKEMPSTSNFSSMVLSSWKPKPPKLTEHSESTSAPVEQPRIGSEPLDHAQEISITSNYNGFQTDFARANNAGVNRFKQKNFGNVQAYFPPTDPMVTVPMPYVGYSEPRLNLSTAPFHLQDIYDMEHYNKFKQHKPDFSRHPN